VLPGWSLLLQSAPKFATITPMVPLYQSPEIPVTLRAGWNALQGSDTLLKSTLARLHSTSSQILLEDPSIENSFCEWTTIVALRLICRSMEYEPNHIVTEGSNTRFLN
jgi:hypothetical protein